MKKPLVLISIIFSVLLVIAVIIIEESRLKTMTNIVEISKEEVENYRTMSREIRSAYSELSVELSKQKNDSSETTNNHYELVDRKASLEQCLVNNNLSDYPVGIATIEGYYSQVEKSAWEETKFVDCFTITGGSSEMIRSYLSVIGKGNTVSFKNSQDQPVINLDFSNLNSNEIELIKSSESNNTIELIVFRKKPTDSGVAVDYSTIVILRIK